MAQDRLDGLTVDAGDWWFNLRPSNTEPLLRLNLEAPDAVVRRAHRRGARTRARRERIAPSAGSLRSRKPDPVCRSKEARHGARPEAARDPRVPRRQGPAALLRRRGHALQPATEASLPRARRRHPRPAHRRRRDRRRRRRCSPHEEGRRPTESLRPSRRDGFPRTDSPELSRSGSRAARATRRRARSGRNGAGRRAPEGRFDPQHRRVGHGRLRDLRRCRRRGVQRRAAGADHGAQADPHAGVRRPGDARVRGVVLGRHRGDGVDGVERGREGRADRRGLVRW